ncbi:hypothetical protein SJX93_20800 [Streptomyces cyaneofuscatus]|uniref:hypothetical protein n=1 Tax=Streptomyces cyaneofuscatus TaxID=66883 RepID=UPI002D79159E|nr:hypothetical protein [Streptomyces cyaneofuscatus]WRO11879.1 hypothetical protein SJX93_20800 [Streptomyces cyaneofuscatus]
MTYTDAEDRSPQLRGALESVIGGYMAAVAEVLLTEGVPVAGVSAYGDVHDPSQDDFAGDVEGSVEFTRAFSRTLVGDGGETGLLWCGVSGWCFFHIPEGSGRSLLDSARWMGSGLTPEPVRVAAFLSEVRLDPREAGSGERPFYRAPHSDPGVLLRRLEIFGAVVEGSDPGADDVVTRLRSTACRRRAVEALTAADQEIVDVALHTGELDALAGLLEYVEGATPDDGLRELARRLARDLALRARDGVESVDEHREAFAYAEEQG